MDARSRRAQWTAAATRRGGRWIAWWMVLALWLPCAGQVFAQCVNTVNPPVLPAGTVGAPYAQSLTSSGPTPTTFVVSAGALPAGVTLAADGTLAGTPTAPASYTFDVQATDASGCLGTRTYTVAIAAPVITLSPAALPNGTVGVPYAQTATASGGSAPYTFTVTAGSLPTGVVLAAGGALSGTPTVAGAYNYTITATDAFGSTGAQTYKMAMVVPTITVAPATLPAAITGVAYAQTATASGGTGPYTFVVGAGSLPPGLALAAGGALSGTPTVAGSYNFTLTATDAFGSSGARAYALTVAVPTIVLTPATLPAAQVGVAYAQTLSASGGVGPYAFAVTAGTLPGGLALAANGKLTGTPAGPGAPAFTLTATDSNGTTGSRSYTLTVANGQVPVAASRTLTTQMGIAVQVDLTSGASGGPFTSAALVGVGAGGSASIDAASQVLTFTPAPGFLGDVQVDYTLSNAYGPSPVASITFIVDTRPDPTQDPDVIGLETGQDASVRIFAETQTRHVGDRLDELHDLGPDLWGWWVSGTSRNGDRDADSDGPAQDFQVDGFTLGGDYRAGTRFTFGGALGYDRSHDRIGVRGSHLGAHASSAIGYGSFHPDLPFFLDGTVGHQRIHVRTTRALPAGASLADGQRDGEQTFTSWSSGYRWKHKTWQLSAYGRLDAAQARLDAYAEDGDPTQALRYDDEAIATRTRTVGVRGKFQHKTGWGIVEPRARVEFLHDFHDRGGTWVQYVDQPDGPRYFLAPQDDGGNREVLELGVVFKTRLLTINLQYLGMYGGAFDNDHAFSLTFQNAR
jgi:uncharacterized protein YhjY with autotransporter beta-barrel domain